MVTKTSKIKGAFSGMPVIKGFFSSVILILVFTFILSVILNFSSLADKHISIYISVITLVSLVFGGIIAARAAKSKFILNGIGVGVLYFLALLGYVLISGATITLALLGSKILYSSAAGLAGGIIGSFFN